MHFFLLLIQTLAAALSTAFPAEIDYTLPLGAEAFVYLNPEEEAVAGVEAPEAYYWYGIQSMSTGPALVATDWTRYYEHTPEMGLLPRLEPTHDGVRLLLGSLVPLPTGTLQGQLYEGYEGSFGYAPAVNQPLLSATGLALLGAGARAELWVGNGEVIQQLNRGISGHPSHLVFRGDLDRDGRPDYIIGYGDRAATEVLYLSSVAKAGSVVSPVARCHYYYWE